MISRPHMVRRGSSLGLNATPTCPQAYPVSPTVRYCQLSGMMVKLSIVANRPWKPSRSAAFPSAGKGEIKLKPTACSRTRVAQVSRSPYGNPVRQQGCRLSHNESIPRRPFRSDLLNRTTEDSYTPVASCDFTPGVRCPGPHGTRCVWATRERGRGY